MVKRMHAIVHSKAVILEPRQLLGGLVPASDVSNKTTPLTLHDFTASAFSAAVAEVDGPLGKGEVVCIENIALSAKSSQNSQEHGEIYLIPDPNFKMRCNQSFIGQIQESVWPTNDGVFSFNFAFLLHPPSHPVPCVPNSVSVHVPEGSELDKIALLKKYREVPGPWFRPTAMSCIVSPRLTTESGETLTNPLFSFIWKNYSAFFQNGDPTFPHATQDDIREKSDASGVLESYSISKKFCEQCMGYINLSVQLPAFGRIGFSTFVATGDAKFHAREIDIVADLDVSYVKKTGDVSSDTDVVVMCSRREDAGAKKGGKK